MDDTFIEDTSALGAVWFVTKFLDKCEYICLLNAPL